MRRPFFTPVLVLSLAAFAAPACFAAPDVVASSTCPVELSAAQRGLGATIPVEPNSKQLQQSFDLSMKNTRLQRIVAAELEVHGTSNKGRVVPARGAVLTTEPSADAVRNVHLASSVPADESRTNTVSVKDLTSVAWISVIELRYSDGTTWHTRPGAECRVTPDGMMLIADK
ncbi:MAG TPA: hypothetical protein VF126_06655 [Acidobacteriaceae bacterium]